MGQIEPIDPARALDRKAQIEGWPFRCAAAANFERPELNAINELWCALAINGIPARADFEARKLKPFLRNITIVERVRVERARWRYRTRLSGAAVTEAVGNHIGQFLEEYLPEEAIPRWKAAYDATLEGGRPLKLMAEFTLPRLNFLTG